MCRLYVIVRTDLGRSSPAVQAGHAVAQYLIEHPYSQWRNEYLIYLQVDSEVELHNWKKKCAEHDL